MRIDDVKAGTYLLVAKLWDEYLSKPGQPFDFTRHRRGEVLELNVDDARRLVSAGAVIAYDPDAPTHAVQADGTVVELVADQAATTGVTIPEDQFAQLVEEIGLPAEATSEDLVRAVQALRQDLTTAQANPPADPPTGAESTRPVSDRIEDIVTWVDGDKAKADIALKGERSTKGDRARPQLVTQLEEILTRP